MRSRIIVGTLLLVGLIGTATRANNATLQWTVVNFVDPVQVKGELIMGPVLIVHDDMKMARGEPCTTFYRFDRIRGPQQALLSFHCLPAQRSLVSTTTLTIQEGDPGCRKLVEYQIAGDSEGHGVPGK